MVISPGHIKPIKHDFGLSIGHQIAVPIRNKK
jgi:hypothetical protein